MDSSILIFLLSTLIPFFDKLSTICLEEMEPNTVSVSARGDGSTNVQKIMEKMNGGGHFSAAALERKNCTVSQIKEELCDVIREVYDESNIA